MIIRILIPSQNNTRTHNYRYTQHNSTHLPRQTRIMYIVSRLYIQ